MFNIDIHDEAAMLQLGARLAVSLKPPLVIHLSGQLGAGKTTLVRGLLTALGHVGAVKSPTYTLVEPYEQLYPKCYHFDLYRLSDPEELESAGIRDYLQPDSVCMIEWPERGKGFMPAANLYIEIKHHKLHSGQRQVKLQPVDPDAEPLLKLLSDGVE